MNTIRKLRLLCFSRRLVTDLSMWVLLVVALLLLTTATWADTFDVNVTIDAHDLNPGDHLCDSSEEEGEQCSLRAAVEEGNALRSDDTVRLVNGESYVLELGEIRINGGFAGILYIMTETGSPGEITRLDTTPLSQLLIYISGRFEMQNVMIRDVTDGLLSGEALSGPGTVDIRDSFFIGNDTAVVEVDGTISGSFFQNNRIAVRTIWTQDLKITDTVFDFNKRSIYVGTGQLHLERVTVKNGQLWPSNASIINRFGFLTIVDSIIQNNQSRALELGCSPDVIEGTIGTKTIVTGTLIAGNKVDNSFGGAVMIATRPEVIDPPRPACIATAWIINSTISGNAASKNGGAIWGSGSEGGSTIHLHNTTIMNNVANSDDSTLNHTTGGIYVQAGINILLRNSIVAGNYHLKDASRHQSDCFGAMQSEGYNIIEQPLDGCSFTGDTNGDQIGIDPELGSLEDNGGLHGTHAILKDSPAIDAGNPTGCLSSLEAALPFVDSELLIDQRNQPRPVDGDENTSVICDPGAYEYNTTILRIFRDGFEG